MQKIANIKIKDIKINGYMIAFMGCLFINILNMFGSFEMKLVSDNIGSIVIPATFAGRDWSELLQKINYYGWGYYILYTPIFLIFKNPYYIYIAVCMCNLLVHCLISVLIYHIAIKYLKLDKGVVTAFVASICTSYAVVSPKNFSAELPALLFVWLIAWAVLATYSYVNEKKRFIGGTILVCIIVAYSYNVHTRLIIIFPAIYVAVIAFRILYKKWMLHPIALPVSTLFFFGISKWLKDLIVNEYWNRGTTKIHNANIDLIGQVDKSQNNLTLKSVLDVWISNLYKLNTETYGIMAICVLIMLLLVYRLIKERFFVNKDVEGLLHTEQDFILAGVMGAALIGTMVALPLYYASGIAVGYNEGVENARFSGLTYIRYYYVFFGPIILASFSVMKKRMISLTWKHLLGILACVVLVMIYAKVWVLKHLDVYATNFYYSWLAFSESHIVNFIITCIVVIFITIGSYLLIIRHKYMGLVIGWFVLELLLFIRNDLSCFYNLKGAERADALYEVIISAENTADISNKIYAPEGTNAAYTYMLNDWTIQAGLPPVEDGNAIAISGTENPEGAELMVERGYTQICLDNEEYLWTDNEAVAQIARDYVAEVRKQTHVFASNDYHFEKGYYKWGKYIKTLKEPWGIIVNGIHPFDAQYLYTYSMEVVAANSDQIGHVEIVINDEVVGWTELDYNKETKMATASLSAFMTEIDDVKLRIYLEEDIIVKNLEINYQWNE